MVSVFKLLLLMTWKSGVIRKRSWLITALEVLVPLLCMYLIYTMSKRIRTGDMSNYSFIIDSNPSEWPLKYKDASTNLGYLPTDNFTDTVMDDVIKCFTGPTSTKEMLSKFSSSSEIENWLKNQTESGNAAVVLIFDKFDSVRQTYEYTVRTNLELPTELTKDIAYAAKDRYTKSNFLNIQVCTDWSILKSLQLVPSEKYLIKLGRLPEVPNTVNLMMLVISMLLVVSTVPLIISILANLVQEKVSGIKEMMKMSGIPSYIIWFHWLIYNMIVYLPMTIIITLIFTVIEPPVIRANPIIVWLLLFLFMVNAVVLVFFTSCFFNNSKLANSIVVSSWLIVNLTLCFVADPFKINQMILQVLLCILIPFINLSWTLSTISSFEKFSDSFTTEHIFAIGYTGSNMSVGMSLIIFVLSTVLYGVATAYLDAVRPGPYGIAKSPFFVCDWLKHFSMKPSKTEENIEPRTSLPKHFEPPPKNTKVGIEIRGLRKVYGRHKKLVAVDNVDLDIYEGEIMVLLGHNGAGKTTTMSMITGLFSATKGTIKVNGKSIEKNLRNFRESLGLCTQHDLYFSKLTTIEHLVFFGVLKGRTFSQSRQVGMDLLGLLNIGDKANCLGRKLSGGMKRRLCLANSLIGNPKILILDEPTSGLDPETRRIIWRILLGLRGSRTVLITTHYMEEADVLGDRIAIMDHGIVICCGTTMFLKRLYGSGYNVHVLVKPQSSIKNISSLIADSVSDFQTRVVSPSQVDFTIKGDYVDRFPTLFSNLERSKVSLGITGISVSIATLEEVFLKVAEQKEKEQSNRTKEKKKINNDSQFEIVEGFSLFLQRTEALLKKRIIHIKNKWLSYIIFLVSSCLLIVLMLYSSKYKPLILGAQDPLLISLKAIYPNTVNPVKASGNSSLEKIAIEIIKGENGEVLHLSQNENTNDYDEKLAKKDFKAYLNKALIGLTISQQEQSSSSPPITELIVQYQPTMNIHTPAIAANLIANVMLKSNYSDGSIKVTNHPYVLDQEALECPPEETTQNRYISNFQNNWILYMGIALMICMYMYVDLIAEEYLSGFRHQQMIAGLPFVHYWCFNFLFDYCIYIITISIWLIIIVFFGSKYALIENSDLLIMIVLVLLLNGISSIPFIYFLSYVISGSRLQVLILTLNAMFVVGGIILVVIIKAAFFNYDTVMLIYCTLSFNPTFATIMSLAYIAERIVTRYLCQECHVTQFCQSKVSLWDMPSKKEQQTILLFVLFLSLLWVLYLFVVLLLDSNLYRRLFLCFCRTTSRKSWSKEEDDDVIDESYRVQAIKDAEVEAPLLVDGLVKKFKCGPKAVDKVSFTVERGECFGLLGVNGAGKTTTFKILTSELLPNSGDANVSGVSVFNRGKYIQRIGYCPQFDACLKMLTGKQTLKIIALIRGVPRNEVRTEVNNWLAMMGILEHGDKKTSAYSGGTRRKLSTAMAFMGEPIVVLLDEPTTGVDPVSRRKLWSVIQARQRLGQALVLTSHSMEECEALCTRLTIMKQGRMRCIGSVEYLKNKFRQGFVVDVTFLDPTVQQLTEFKKGFIKHFPNAELKDENDNMVQYEVPDADRLLSSTFAELLRLKQEYAFMKDFTVNNTTLEQIFLSFAVK